jgi:multisubunit Na+/H+ antiporter MnhC subunit
VVAVLAATLVSMLFGRIGVLFDVVFVLVCVAAALWVRPRDFFSIGVLPPLLLGFTVVVLAVVDRAAVAKAGDPVVQAVVSGLAHHALALVIGYALTLVVLALRQVALRHHGTLRVRSSR